MPTGSCCSNQKRGQSPLDGGRREGLRPSRGVRREGAQAPAVGGMAKRRLTLSGTGSWETWGQRSGQGCSPAEALASLLQTR